MQITALVRGKKDKERINVFVDQEFKIAIDENTLVQEHLFVGKEVTNDSLNKLKDLDTYNLTTRKIINWVYIKPRSSKEISDKIKKILSNRKSSSFNTKTDFLALNEFVINKLDALGFNNKSYATWLIENRVHQGKYGRQRIYSELVSKGIQSSLAKDLLNTLYPQDNRQIEQILKKKFGVTTVKDIKDLKLKNKAYRYLISKGFHII